MSNIKILLLLFFSFIEKGNSAQKDLPDVFIDSFSVELVNFQIGALIGHAGNDFGTTTLMCFSPKSGIGRILFTNISIEMKNRREPFTRATIRFLNDLTNKASR